MRSAPIRLVKYLIGFSLALIAVTNCFNVLSSSSDITALPVDHAARAEQQKPATRAAAPNASRSASRHGNLFEVDSGLKAISLSDFVTRASSISPLASPGSPIITATKSHMLPPGDTQADPGDTVTYTIIITNSGSGDATGVNLTDTIDPNTTLVAGSVIASPIAVDDSYHTIGNVNISVPAAQGVIANDTNPNGAGTLTVTKVNATVVPGGGSATASTANGSVTMSSDGSFTYNPNVAFRGPSDSFTYTLGNGTGKTDTATVTIAVNGLIWFVNVAAPPGGDGRLSSPFNCLVGPGCFDPAAADIANDNIFVYTGVYTGGLTLLNGQKLIGQGAGDTLINITGLTQPSGTNMLPATGGANPTIAAAGANVTLGSGNTIRGVSINGTAPAAVDLLGSAFGTVTIAETALDGVGQALNLTSGTLNGPVASTAAFTSVSSLTSSTTGISLTGVAGNMSSGSTTITSSSGVGISVGTSSAALNFGNTTSTLSGGAGVSLNTNTGPITFGALNISPLANQRGLLATNNSATITSGGGAITTSAATAVEITRASGTTPLVMSLTSVTANGGPNGIKLSNTSGSFAVTGDGASDPANTTRGRTTAKQGGGTVTLGSGGTINNTTGPGVSLTNTTNVTLGNVSLTGNGGGVNSGADGINAVTSSSLTLDNVLVTGHLGNDGLSGNAVSGLSLMHTDVHTNATTAGTEALDIWNVRLDNLTGTSAVTNSLFFNSREDIFFITNTGTSNLSLTVTNSEFRDAAVSPGNVAFGISANGSSVTNVTATNSKFSNVRTTGFQYAGNNTSSGTVNVRNSVFEQNGVDVDVAHQGAGTTLNYEVSGNTMRQTFKANSSVAINVFLGGLSTAGSLMTGTVKNNVIGNPGVANSGSDLGAGIQINPSGAGTLTASVTGNIVTQVRGSSSSVFVDIINDTAKHNLFIHNNTFSGNPAEAFGVAALEMDNGTGTPGENGIFCLDMAANTATMSASSFASVYLATFSGTTNVVGYTGAANSEPQLQNFFGDSPGTTPPGVNTLTSPATAVFVIGGTVQGSASCGIVFPTSVEPDLSTQGAGATDAAKDISDTATQNDNALRSTWGEATKQDGVQMLTRTALNWMVQAAIERWRQAGVSAEELAAMQAASFEIADLPDGQIANISSSHIWIDESAAGHGWYIDEFPNDDSEFDVPVPGRELQTTEFSPAHGKMDLLTVVTRELGSRYLQGRKRIPKQFRSLMNETLSPAVRRMPAFNISNRSTSRLSPAVPRSGNDEVLANTPSQADNDRYSLAVLLKPAVFNPSRDLTPGSYAQSVKRMPYAASARRVAAFNPPPFSGETVNLNIGTIPPGESVTIMFSVTIDSPFPSGVCTVTNQGHVTGSNFSQVDTNVNVVPVVAPVAIGACPANITTNTDLGVCTAVVTYTTPTASGCPSATVTCVPASGSSFPKGMTTVTCTATNGTPPDSTCTFTVTVKDAQAPTCNLPANIVQNTDPGQCSAVVTYTASASDNCPGATIACIPASGSTFPKGLTTVNCTASDTSPDSPDTNCSFTVTINDSESPTIGACPAPIITNTAPGMCSAVVTYATPSANDNCPGVTVGCSPPSGSGFPKGATPVTCTATDTSGHTAACSFSVTVIDNQPPSITCPGNINTTEDSPGSGCATVTYTTPTPSDNCPGATANCVPASGTCFAIGTTPVTCTAMDTSGNTSSCQFTVTVTAIGLTALSPAKVWIGLKNSDDVGTKFDLLAEVLRNGSVVGSGQLNDVPGGSSGFNNAVLRTITLALSSAVPMGPGDTMSFRLSVRVGATSGHNSGTARLWYNGAAIDSGASRDAGSRFDATIAGSTSDYFLRSPGFTLSTTAGSSRTSVDKLVSNSGGNPWVAFGTWSKTF